MENIRKIGVLQHLERGFSKLIRCDFFRGTIKKTTTLLSLLIVLTNCASSSLDSPPQKAEIPFGTALILTNLPLAQDCEREAKRPLSEIASADRCSRSLKEEYLTHRQRATVHINRGVIRYRAGRYEEAVEDFTTAIDRYGMKTLQAYTNRGLTYEILAMEQRRYEALARSDYETAIALNSNAAVAKARLEELNKPFLERRPLNRKIRS